MFKPKSTKRLKNSVDKGDYKSAKMFLVNKEHPISEISVGKTNTNNFKYFVVGSTETSNKKTLMSPLVNNSNANAESTTSHSMPSSRHQCAPNVNSSSIEFKPRFFVYPPTVSEYIFQEKLIDFAELTSGNLSSIADILPPFPAPSCGEVIESLPLGVPEHEESLLSSNIDDLMCHYKPGVNP